MAHTMWVIKKKLPVSIIFYVQIYHSQTMTPDSPVPTVLKQWN